MFATSSSVGEAVLLRGITAEEGTVGSLQEQGQIKRIQFSHWSEQVIPVQ